MFLLHMFFLPRDAMRKRGLCSRPASISWWIVSTWLKIEDIVKFLVRPGSPITLVFLKPSAGT